MNGSEYAHLLDKPIKNKIWIVYWSHDYDSSGIDEIYRNPDDAWNSIHLKDKMTGLTYTVSEHDVEGVYHDDVWIVTWSNYMEYGVEKVFATEIDAKSYIRHRDKMTGLHYFMEQVKINKKEPLLA